MAKDWQAEADDSFNNGDDDCFHGRSKSFPYPDKPRHVCNIQYQKGYEQGVAKRKQQGSGQAMHTTP